MFVLVSILAAASLVWLLIVAWRSDPDQPKDDYWGRSTFGRD